MTKTLRELREEKCITQVEMAAELECSSVSICVWESGSMPSMQHRRKLAKFFDLPIPVMLEVLKTTKKQAALSTDLAAVGA